MIYYPKTFGTCGGANKAINLAYELRCNNLDKNIYIFKEILHNPFIIEDLKKHNIICIDNLDQITRNDLLIIRAHGEPKSTFDYLEKKGITYYDATCVNVQKIHDLVIEKSKDYKIIIIGKKNHPEVIGTNGWCDNNAIIVEDENDYKKIIKSDKYYVVCQTTIGYDKVSNLLNYLKENKIDYDFNNTICNHQKLIQTSSLDLASKMDIMIVIGGEDSSNTKELFKLCSKVCKSYYFSDIKTFYNFIKKEKLLLKTKIGITGGASTPKKQLYEYAHLLEFMIYYKNKLNELTKEITKYNKTLLSNDNKIVIDAINKFINMNSDGKFLRGCLMDLGYKLNKNDNYADELAIAYETFQTSILIHDDIIDNAVLRRNKETIPQTYLKEFNNQNDDTYNSLALCIGDLGFYFTNKLIINKYKNDKNFSKLFDYYNNIVINTIKGEILDVYLPFKEQNHVDNNLSEDDIMEIYRLKTSWYSIVGPFALGMILGNSKQKEINQMEQILEPLGIAFQIKDDILGIYSSNDILGKPVFSDIEEFKQTILYSYIKLNKKDYYKKLLKYYGKKNITKEDALEVQNIIKESGSLEYATNKMNELFTKSRTQIEELNMNEYIKNILLGLITYLEIREK